MKLQCQSWVYLYLWSLCLNPSHTPRAIDDGVLWYDLTGVDLTESTNYTATGKDHIPANISCKTKGRIFIIKCGFHLLPPLQHTLKSRQQRDKHPTFRFNHIVVPNF